MAHQRILVELDALLDTRIATVSRIHEESAVQLLTDDRYFERVIDDFEPMCGVTVFAFRQAYEKRDVALLAQSRITQIPMLLNELVKKMEIESTSTPFVESVSVDVNVWPYDLTREERDVMISAVMAYAGVQTLAHIVSYPPEELTPQFIKRHYSGMILYNFRDWLKPNMDAFKSCMMPRVTVLAPALFYEQIPKREDFADDDMRADVNPFELSELACIELFRLNLLNSGCFSIYRFQQ